MDEKLKSRFLGLYCMVMADGIVAAKELEKLYSIGRESYSLTPQEITEAITTAGTSFVAPTELEEKLSILYQLSEIAWADGKIDDTEKNLLLKYVVRLGLPEENSNEIAEYFLNAVKDGKSENDIIDELKN